LKSLLCPSKCSSIPGTRQPKRSGNINLACHRSIFAMFSLSIAFTCLVVPASAAVLEPARASVSSKTSANAGLFPAESVQLTDAIIQSIAQHNSKAHLADLIAFDSSDRSYTSCKTYPNDTLWPSHSTWNDLNTLLDGSLIQTTPIAAPCYDSRWGQKNSTRCNSVVRDFGIFPTQ
jgi:hypothetical protein